MSLCNRSNEAVATLPLLCEDSLIQSSRSCQVLCAAHEFEELPVRHNEDKLNLQLARDVRWEVDTRTLDDPHTKANLLLQVSVRPLLVLL